MSANVLALPSATVTTSGSSASALVGTLTTLAVNVNVTAVSGTTPTLDLFLEGQDDQGVWYQLWHPTQIAAVGDVSTGVGPGLATNVVAPPRVRLRWVVGGVTPSFTFSASVVGR